MSCFLDSSSSFTKRVLRHCFHVLYGSHLLHFLVATFKWETTFCWSCYMFCLLWPTETPAPCFLLPLVAGFLNLYVFSWSFHRPILFSWRWRYRSGLWFFPLATDPWPVFKPAPCLPELAVIAPFRIYTQGACCRVGRGMELELGKLGMLTVQLEESLGKVFPAAHESASYWSPKCSQQKLHPFNALWYSYLHLSCSHSPSHRHPLLQERNGFL